MLGTGNQKGRIEWKQQRYNKLYYNANYNPQIVTLRMLAVWV